MGKKKADSNVTNHLDSTFFFYPCSDLINLVHLSIRGLHTDTDDHNQNTEHNKQSTTSGSGTSQTHLTGEGIKKPDNMTSKYNAKIQAILQNNTDYTLEEKNEIIQELLMQACIILSTPPSPPTDSEWGGT